MKSPTHFSFFQGGLRPFFLLATGFSVVAVALWMIILSGWFELGSVLSPTDWHVHEMLFGYTSAVIAGFLLTAMPNWTGQAPLAGWPLACLAALWLVGRCVVLGWGGFSTLWVMLIDVSFLVVIGGFVALQLIASKNWRNLIVVALVGLLVAANIGFYLEVMATGTTAFSRRAGFAAIVMLITLIGGRIIPSFTRNWLVKHEVSQFPAPFGRFDTLCLLVSLVAFILWIAGVQPAMTAPVLGLAAGLHVIRLGRWQGYRVRRSALLLMLHLAYLCLPIGLALIALSLIDARLGAVSVMHVLGMGGVGGMTSAVMMRASMGHTGRPLAAGRVLGLAFSLIMSAAFMRAFAPGLSIAGLSGIEVAVGLWIIGFGVICLRIWPWLLRPSAKP